MKKRIFGLDVLRAIAIMTVLVGHTFYVLDIPHSSTFLRCIFFDGVNIFFTLSGFLIGRILLKKLSDPNPTLYALWSFWRDRWLRTLPAYFTVLLAIAIAYFSMGVDWQTFLPYLFFVQNLHTGNFEIFRESWSLTIEEWFYLTTPVMFFIAGKMMPLKKAVPLIIILIFLLGNAWRIMQIERYDIKDYYTYVYRILMAIPTRIDAVVFGVLGAYLAYYDAPIWSRYRHPFFLIGVIGFIANHYYGIFAGLNTYVLYFQKQVESLFVLMTIPLLSTVRESKGKVAKVITFVSVISYSIYLTHAALFMIIKPVLPKGVISQVIIYFSWSFIMGYALWGTVEKAGLDYRQRLKERKFRKRIRRKPEAVV